MTRLQQVIASPSRKGGCALEESCLFGSARRGGPVLLDAQRERRSRTRRRTCSEQRSPGMGKRAVCPAERRFVPHCRRVSHVPNAEPGEQGVRNQLGVVRVRGSPCRRGGSQLRRGQETRRSCSGCACERFHRALDRATHRCCRTGAVHVVRGGSGTLVAGRQGHGSRTQPLSVQLTSIGSPAGCSSCSIVRPDDSTLLVARAGKLT